ncbi:MAG TPA: LysM peptidoglycan-binding domain-containing protein [Verrucomicrobiae bacterium]|nr:LysM peptidoglycan-binding domain-containing protein [Verrucomicrobiae bacterium]
MNSPSPFIPQGSNLEQQNKSRSSLKIKIFCALGINVAVLLVLLMQGCKREQPQQEAELIPVYSETNPPPIDTVDTNLLPPVETNTVVQLPPTPAIDSVTATPPPPVATTQEYTIQKGDMYSTIAPKFGVTVKALQTANPSVDPAKLQIGKKIVIPAPTVATPSAAPVVDTATGETIYTVKSGDTLGAIATQFRTSVKAIQTANGLVDTRIKVGQKLKIPKS